MSRRRKQDLFRNRNRDFLRMLRMGESPENGLETPADDTEKHPTTPPTGKGEERQEYTEEEKGEAKERDRGRKRGNHHDEVPAVEKGHKQAKKQVSEKAQSPLVEQSTDNVQDKDGERELEQGEATYKTAPSEPDAEKVWKKGMEISTESVSSQSPDILPSNVLDVGTIKVPDPSGGTVEVRAETTGEDVPEYNPEEEGSERLPSPPCGTVAGGGTRSEEDPGEDRAEDIGEGTAEATRHEHPYNTGPDQALNHGPDKYINTGTEGGTEPGMMTAAMRVPLTEENQAIDTSMVKGRVKEPESGVVSVEDIVQDQEPDEELVSRSYTISETHIKILDYYKKQKINKSHFAAMAIDYMFHEMQNNTWVEPPTRQPVPPKGIANPALAALVAATTAFEERPEDKKRTFLLSWTHIRKLEHMAEIRGKDYSDTLRVAIESLDRSIRQSQGH